MNTKIIYSIAVLAVAVLAAVNVRVNTRGNGLSDVSLANVEALAEESSGKGTLMGTVDGKRYCCCPGTNSCGAASCSSSVCN
jgi:hypothetical protein